MAKIEIEHEMVNTIVAGTVIKGNVEAKGDFRLDGILEGDVKLSGKLVVGQHGSITGNVECKEAIIIGKVVGNIRASELLTLKNTANIKGDILINRLSVESGAAINGNCRMLDEVPAPTAKKL